MKTIVSTKSSLVIILALVVLGGAAFAQWTWFGFVAGKVQSIQEITYATNNTTEKFTKLQALRREQRDTADARARIRELVVTQERIPEFLNILERTTTGDVFVRSVQVDHERPALLVSLVYAGTFEELSSVTRQLTELPYAAYIDSLDVRKGANGQWDAYTRLTVVMSEVVEE